MQKSVTPVASAVPVTRRRLSATALWAAGFAALICLAFVSLAIGRYPIPLSNVVGVIISNIWPIEAYWTGTEERVVELLRLPRVLAAMLAGAGLAISGAALQGAFRNPLVGPDIIGVSSGAGFGGAVAIIAFDSAFSIVVSAFLGGMVAVFIVYLMSRISRRAPVLMLVLSGVITGAFFSALISLVKYIADTENELPTIVYWLMGSFASVSWSKTALLALIVGVSAILLLRLRFRINVLSIGDEEAQALGIPVTRTRWIILTMVALISAAVISAAGIVGWVGLVVPHFARLVVGPDHKRLLPAAMLIGAFYLLLIDNIARTATAAELPLSIITALIGAPIFGLLLMRSHEAGWRS